MARGRSSNEYGHENQLSIGSDPNIDEPPSPASRPNSHRQCLTCRNKIGGSGAIHLNDVSYHRTCFRCSECRVGLDVEDDYTEIKGRVLCKSCHVPSPGSSARGPPVCAGCNGVITGKSIKALGAVWHDVHLQCAHCRQPLTRGHVEHRGRAYCPEDFTHLFLPKCKGCTKPVEREALVALDGKWHTKCFNCQVCHKPFPNKSFYVFQKQPFCKFHYHMLNNSICKRCEAPIEGPVPKYWKDDSIHTALVAR
ncbi:hypothetical protein BDF19DRAFT_234229 [Syncephalis fuscata]|nr:hypothetical protein BDF19DRAFT_234229 [Syncephalis fuscata]